MAKERSNFVDDLRAELAEFAETAEALALDLRLDFAEIIVARLEALGWSQRDLADATGMKESFISRVIHSNANCTLATIAKILSALEVRASLVEEGRAAAAKRAGRKERRSGGEAA